MDSLARMPVRVPINLEATEAMLAALPRARSAVILRTLRKPEVGMAAMAGTATAVRWEAQAGVVAMRRLRHKLALATPAQPQQSRQRPAAVAALRGLAGIIAALMETPRRAPVVQVVALLRFQQPRGGRLLLVVTTLPAPGTAVRTVAPRRRRVPDLPQEATCTSRQITSGGQGGAGNNGANGGNGASSNMNNAVSGSTAAGFTLYLTQIT
jgi:hypothetical protein